MATLRQIDLNLLVALDVLLDERSVTRAAARLGLTQSAVSGILARLRGAFDDPLFVRTQHGLLPTPGAERLCLPLKRWLADGGELLAPSKFDPQRWGAAIAISTTDYMQRAVLQPLFSVLRVEAPKLRVAVLPLAVRDLADRMARGDVDLAVTAAELAPPDFPSRRLYRERYVVCMRRTHPLARRKRLALDDFCAFDHVLVSPTGGSFEGPVDAALARVGRRRRVRLSVPSFLIVPELVAADDLLAVVPQRALRTCDGPLRTTAPPVEVPHFDVVAVWHARTHEDAAHRWLRDRLARSVRASHAGPGSIA